MKAQRVVLAAVVVGVCAWSVEAGVVYTAITRGEGSKGAEMANVTVKAWVADDKAKVEFEESGNPMIGKGNYLLTNDGGETLYLVNPQEKTYAKWDLNEMMGMAGGAVKMARGMMNMKFSQPAVEKVIEEPGQPIVGLPTTHYRYHTTYTMSLAFMGMKRDTKIDQMEDIWAAPQLTEAAFGVWLRKGPPKTGDEQLDALIAAQMSKMHGVPLKTVTVTTHTDEKKGTSETTTTTMEVTSMQTVPIPDSAFVLPSDYKETQLLPTGEEGGEGKTKENPLSKLLGGKKKG
jgi:hypothetical protein